MASNENSHDSQDQVHFNDLNEDVIFEIFLRFVAIDWDGPFSLTLVCTQWRDLVISKPRLWTWVMIDDSKADWKERVDVAAYLSKGLPLQVILRLPFGSLTSMSYITRRCTTLIVESGCRYYLYWVYDWYSVKIVPKSGLTRGSRFKDLEESLDLFLKDAPRDQIRILSGDRDYACFTYSIWKIHDDIMAGKVLVDVLTGKDAPLITSLVFSMDDIDGQVAPNVHLSELWELLPMLVHLSHLELSDNVIKWSKDIPLSPLCLPGLQSLHLNCPTTLQPPVSFQVGAWLGLFSLLGYLSLPCIEGMVLGGSVHQVLSAMMRLNTNIRPSDLIISIFRFDEAGNKPNIHFNAAWCRLTRFTINLPLSGVAFSQVSFEYSIRSIQWILSFLPKDCPTRVFVNEHSVPLGISGIEDSRAAFKISPEERASSETLRSFVCHIARLRTWIYFRTNFFTEIAVVEGEQLLTTSLDCTHVFFANLALSGTMYSLMRLEDLRCDAYTIFELVSKYKMMNLRALALVGIKGGGIEDAELVTALVARASTLPCLSTISINYVLSWQRLIQLLRGFRNTNGRGISALKLPGFPYPPILREVVAALEGSLLGGDEKVLDVKMKEYYKTGGGGCVNCFRSGWSCFEARSTCPRFSEDRMVTITKDTWVEG